jgi:Flp pilus assembly protein TadG
MSRQRLRAKIDLASTQNSLWDCDRGSALVEAAIVLPIFLMVVGGVCEFSFYIYQQQLIESGVRDAARYLALTRDPNNTICQSNARNLAVYGSTGGGTTFRVSGWSTGQIAVSISSLHNSSSNYSGGSTIQIVTVSANFTDPSLGFFGLLGITAPTISVSHQERWVGGSSQPTQASC